MNTQRTIQTLCRIGKTLSRIVFVFCIVGFCLCIAGLVSLALGMEAFKLGGLTIQGLIPEAAAALDTPTLTAMILSGIIPCIVEAVLSKMAEGYFARELADETPFTARGAQELMRLGILTIVLPLAAVILCSIGTAIAVNYFPQIEKLSLDDFSQVGIGIAMILAALLCRLGAEKCGEKEDVSD